MYVCLCYAVTEAQVRECVAGGASSLGDLQAQLGVATCCGCCAETAASYLVEAPALQHDQAAIAADVHAQCPGDCASAQCENAVVRPLTKPAPNERVSTRRYPVHDIARAA